MSDPGTLALTGLGLIFFFMLLHVPIGIAMGMAGVLGFAFMTDWAPALAMVASEVANNLASLELLTVPLFILMGAFASVAGLSEDLYRTAYVLVGHKRGGLALATIGGCAGFGAVCGSSVATAATFGRAALPSMLQRGYDPGFSGGTVAAGGTLGILIPPSSVMVIYAVLSQELIVTMYLAALVPALLAIVLHACAIYLVTVWRPALAPVGERASWKERLQALKQSWQVILLALVVLGGMAVGAFTATEAAAVGATMAFGFAVARRTLTRAGLRQVLKSTASVSAMIYVLLIGATLFGYFAAVTQAPQLLAQAIEASGIPIPLALAALILMYILAGAFFDELAALVISMPFVLPMILAWGFDPIWWGIIMVVVIEIGQLAPPLGMNVFVVHGVAPTIPLSSLYRGVMPYLGSNLLRLAVLMIFPALVLWLPSVLQ